MTGFRGYQITKHGRKRIKIPKVAQVSIRVYR
jgi:hypothetical protein